MSRNRVSPGAASISPTGPENVARRRFLPCVLLLPSWLVAPTGPGECAGEGRRPQILPLSAARLYRPHGLSG